MKIGHVKSRFRVSIFKVSMYRFRRLKVLILTFTDVFLIDNGSLTDSSKKRPIPLILLYLEMANFPKKWPISCNRQEGLATSKSTLSAV